MDMQGYLQKPRILTDRLMPLKNMVLTIFIMKNDWYKKEPPIAGEDAGSDDGGRPKTDPKIIKKAVKLYRTGQYSIKEDEELTGVKKSTLYRNLQADTNEER